MLLGRWSPAPSTPSSGTTPTPTSSRSTATSWSSTRAGSADSSGTHPVAVERTGVTTADVPASYLGALDAGVEETSVASALYVANLQTVEVAPDESLAARRRRRPRPAERRLMESGSGGWASPWCSASSPCSCSSTTSRSSRPTAGQLPEQPPCPGHERSQPRGDILSADGVVLASSVPRRRSSTSTSGSTTRTPPPSSPRSSGTTRSTASPGSRPSTTVPRVPHPAGQDPAGPAGQPHHDRQRHPDHQERPPAAGGRSVDAVDVNSSAPEAGAVVLNVKTGAIEAMYGTRPSTRPAGLPTEHREVRLEPAQLQQGREPAGLPGLPAGLPTGVDLQGGDLGRRLRPPAGAGQVNYPVVGCISVPQTPLPLCNYHHELCGGTIQQTLPQSCNTPSLRWAWPSRRASAPRRRPSGSTS